MFSNYSEDTEEINISYKGLTSLPDLSKFKNLKRFYCNHNQLSHLPPLPSTLQLFYCYDNQLSHLPPLPSTLQELICSNNQLTRLPPLPSTLQYFVFSNNSFSLPLKTIEQWKFYSGFIRLKAIYQNDLAKKIQRKWR